MECEYCKKLLKTVSSLNYHRKNNKKCSEIQKKMSNDNELDKIKLENSKLLSENKTLTDKYNKLKVEMSKMKEYIIKIETENNIYSKDHETVTTIAKQPKSTTNHSNYNLSVVNYNLIKDRFSDVINNAPTSQFYEGQRSIGRFVAPCLQNEDGTKMIACTDYSRNVFVYKDEKGNINKDIKCKNLANIIEPIATAKVNELMKEDIDKRSKIYRIKSLRKDIISRKEDIEKLENFLQGLEKSSPHWCYIRDQISQKENDIEMYNIELMNIDNEDYIDDNKYYDEKLYTAADDIKDMKNNTNKFSKTISELV